MRSCKQSHLRCFVTVAELGSISEAAGRLHRTPSAVSMTITQLEAHFERPLFEAGSKRRLTPFGQFVFDTASEQLKQFDRGLESIHAYARNDIGRVDIAAVPSFASRHLPGLLADFVAQYPQVTLSIGDDSSEHINRQIEQGTIDVGIASPSADFDEVQCHPVLTDPMGVVCSREHPLAQLQRPLAWDDLAAYRFIGNGTCRLIDDAKFQALLNDSDMDVQNTTSLLALVATGFGITTLPQLALVGVGDEVVFKPTRYPDLQRTIGVLTSRNRSLSPAATAFVDFVGEGVLNGV